MSRSTQLLCGESAPALVAGAVNAFANYRFSGFSDDSSCFNTFGSSSAVPRKNDMDAHKKTRNVEDNQAKQCNQELPPRTHATVSALP